MRTRPEATAPKPTTTEPAAKAAEPMLGRRRKADRGCLGFDV